MFARMAKWTVALVFGATLMAGPVKAVTTVSIAPGGGPYALAIGTEYDYSTPGGIFGLAAGTGNTDIFRFSAASTFAGVINTTIAFGLGDTAGFKKFDLTWVNEASPLTILASASFVPGGSVVNLPLPVAVAGVYRLIIDWATKPSPSLGASYQTSLFVPGDRQSDLPLPPALLLFGSALVGLGVLGRRKRNGATV